MELGEILKLTYRNSMWRCFQTPSIRFTISQIYVQNHSIWYE